MIRSARNLSQTPFCVPIGGPVWTPIDIYWGLQYTTATNNLMMQGAMPPMILASAPFIH